MHINKNVSSILFVIQEIRTYSTLNKWTILENIILACVSCPVGAGVERGRDVTLTAQPNLE
jgi:hypothetical protein